VLGCSNCREKYPVRDGAVDFGDTPAAAAAPDDAGGRAGATNGEAGVERLAALLGVTEGPAFVVLAGPATAQAGALADMIAELEVLTIGAAAVNSDSAGVNRIYANGPVLPIASGRVAGVALTGTAADALLDDGARIVAPLGRLVLEPVPSDAATRLERHGMRIAAQEDHTAVAVRG
jgi:hypothetical protein